LIKSNRKSPFVEYLNKIYYFINNHQVKFIFLFFFVVYNLNFRNISSGDNIPASVIPFAILNSGTPYLENFIPCFEMGYQTTYFLLNSHNHLISFFPIVTPLLITPLYVIPYLVLKFYGGGFSVYDPNLYLIIAIMEKISASIIASLACIFIFLIIKKMFSDKIAWISTITFGLATNTWSTSSQALWQHGMVELLLAIMIYLVLLIEQRDSVKNTILLGLLSGLFIFNRPPDSVFLIPIIIYVLFLKKKAREYYCLSLLLSSLPFAFYNVYTLGGVFGGYDRNVGFLTVGISTLINILGLLFSPNRGLLVYSPILVLSLFGLYRASIIKNRNIRIFIYLFSLPLLLNFLTYASFSTQWWGGFCYGPRFLTGTLPVIIIYLAIFLHYADTNFSLNMKRTFTSIFCVLFIVSLFVQVVGTFYYPNGYWDAEPNIDDNSERLWKWDDNQIMTTYNAGLLEPYFLYPTKGLQKDIVKNAILISGWEGLEPGTVPTRWMINNGTLEAYFLQARDATINFTVLPFNDLKDLQVKVNGNLINEVEVDGLTTISLNTSFRQGRNQIVFYSPQGCKNPMDIPELNSKDSRCLSFAFQNITIENADVIVFSFRD